jgi:hypothetical protein
MKKLGILFMMLTGLAITSCEPMEDIHNDLDNQLDNRAVVGVSEYTLTADDYEELDLDNENFDNLDDAAALIPGLLAEKFPVWGPGSLAQVTFDLNAPNTPEEYTVTEEGYAAVGLDQNYFTKTSEIKDFLKIQFPQAKLNKYVELTYRSIAVEKSYTLTEDDFELISERFEDIYPDPAFNAGKYENFERRDFKDGYWNNDMILEALNVVMDEEFSGVEGQTYEVSYEIYDGSPGMESMKLRYDGNSYVQFGAQAYELNNDDFEFIEAEFLAQYPGPADNAGFFKSFDIRSSSENYWSDDMILEAINALLMENFPTASEGAKFNVSYKTYDGGSGNAVMSVVLKDGEYVINDEETISTIMETQVYGYGDGMWHMPLSLPNGIYTDEFEQRFSNFGSESTAGFYIGRWLEPKFQYAQDGDFVSVGYTYTFKENDVRKFETRYASFVYNEDAREWDFIPTVIPQTLQFGYEANGWVVDNTIVYSLSPADYELIGEELADVYPDPAWSVGNYSNFDRRPGNVNQWTDAMLLEAFNILLNQKVAPNAEEGQKYLLTFDIYNGTNTVEQMHLIKEDGVWIPVEK